MQCNPAGDDEEVGPESENSPSLPEELPWVTVIIPCREEERHIGRTLAAVLANDYPRERLEVLVVDGMSADGTRKVIEEFTRAHGFIRLLDNPKKITAAALNLGISQARGEVILRVDSHSAIPPNYISTLVDWQRRTGADNVGGVCINLPGSETAMARAIALAQSHPFGIGDAYFRLGTRIPRWVDTVPFGCFRREVFARVGLFDEDHVRTEDDEFNLRLKKHGGHLLLVPDLKVHYYTRETLSKIGRMYYQYGYFKALVARKLGAVLKLRHLVPSLFLICLLALGLMGLARSGRAPLGLGVLGVYVFVNLLCAAQAAWQAGAGWTVAASLTLVFPTLHFSYGFGFLRGVWDFFILGKKGVPDPGGVPLTR
jgi:glycosyltransferase involved in cell wall biosynthesis